MTEVFATPGFILAISELVQSDHVSVSEPTTADGSNGGETGYKH